MKGHKKQWLILLFCAASFLLTLHPKGLVMYFAGQNGERIPEFCSYFSMLPVGYGNWCPIITGLSTLAAAILAAVQCIAENRKLHRWIRNCAIVAVIGSVVSLMLFGTMTIFGMVILALMIVVFVMEYRTI